MSDQLREAIEKALPCLCERIPRLGHPTGCPAHWRGDVLSAVLPFTAPRPQEEDDWNAAIEAAANYVASFGGSLQTQTANGLRRQILTFRVSPPRATEANNG